ncbi:MAG: glycosyltransferase [Akkermansiaceae bacterium]|nr:glycosyltransferase [Akkermansiaceae bacterium]
MAEKLSPLKPRLCVVAATPLTFHFFFKQHLACWCKDYEVTVVYNSASDKYLPPLGLPIKEKFIGIERRISPYKDLIALVQLWLFMLRGRFDMVITVVPKAGILGMLAAFFSGRKIRVHIFQGEVWASRSGFMRMLLKYGDFCTARLATSLLAVSPSERDFLEEEGIPPRGSIEVIEQGSICGVDCDRFKPDPWARQNVRTEYGFDAEDIVCIFLGRLAIEKGIYELTRAFKQSLQLQGKLRLMLVGPDEDALEREIRSILGPSAGARLTICPYTRFPERVLACADIHCMPSYREGFGLAIIEASSVGIPSIGTRIYGIVDAIEENVTGLMVPPREVKPLSEAMTRLANDNELRESLGFAARQRAIHNFSQVKIIQSYKTYIDDLLLPTS